MKNFDRNIKKVVDKCYVCQYNTYCSVEKPRTCTSGSVVEYRLAKARVAGSNPVSCFYILKTVLRNEGF